MKKKRILITGGAGFIGCNFAKACLERGYEVTVIDNLSRKGTSHNLQWLKKFKRFIFAKIDIRQGEKINAFLKNGHFDALVHLAGQTAVTTSVVEPFEDFEINARGTLNLLEAIRIHSPETSFIFASTNKVYGSLNHVPVIEKKYSYRFKKLHRGIEENMLLDFHSPYGCSKGCAEQYVRDYARIYGLNTVVFRQSCIYGPRQFGVEDQGWVAWFTIACELDLPVFIYGNGKQTRDLLHVDDLSDAFFQALGRIDKVRGQIFNLGGGSKNALSVLELIEWLRGQSGKKRWLVKHADWRPGDQLIYVSDTEKARKMLGWQPAISIKSGLLELYAWIKDNRRILSAIRKP